MKFTKTIQTWAILLLAVITLASVSSCGVFKKSKCDRCPEFTENTQTSDNTPSE